MHDHLLGSEGISLRLLFAIARPIDMIKPKAVVVDSSVIVKWFNQENEQYIKNADTLLGDWESGTIAVFAPELAKYEVVNALLYKQLTEPALKASIAAFYSLPIVYKVQTEEASKETGVIAQKQKITFYDATFLQLAHELGASLVTANPKHQKSTKSVRVIPLSDY